MQSRFDSKAHLAVVILAAIALALALIAAMPAPITKIALTTAVDDCAICSGEDWLSCKRCEGRGEHTRTCEDCTGKRKLPCPFCRESGKFTCYNCGGEGRIRWKGGDRDPCRVCSRGKIDCPWCSGKKSIDCATCENRGRLDHTCEACAGVGTFPCPRSEPPRRKDCRVCEDSGYQDCASCLGTNIDASTCKKCYGFGRLLCPEKECIAGRERCSSCYGSGKLRYVTGSGSRAGTKKCNRCEGRGYEPCTKCRGRGSIDCPPTTTKSCSDCKLIEGKRKCTVCKG